MLTSPFDMGLKDGTIFQNPYPIYEYLRSHDQVHWSELKKTWVITLYDDVEQCLADTRFTAKRDGVQLRELSENQQRKLEPLREFYARWMMYLDPPDHTRIRKAASKPFTRKHLFKVTENVYDSVNEWIGSLVKGKKCELVSEFADPLCLHILCNILEIPQNDHQVIYVWSQSIVEFMQGRSQDTLASALRAHASVRSLEMYLYNLFQSDLDEQKLEMIKHLSDLRHNGELSDQEVLSVFANILVDGQEPISHAITNGVLSLASFPSQWDSLVANPYLVDNSVEELLRYDPPFQYVVRHVREDIMMREKTIQAGDRVLLMIASANRDPSKFDDPNSLDLRRESTHHKSFGFGVHACMGSVLARMILKEVFIGLSKKFKHIHIDLNQIERHQALGSRGLKSLPVTFE